MREITVSATFSRYAPLVYAYLCLYGWFISLSINARSIKSTDITVQHLNALINILYCVCFICTKADLASVFMPGTVGRRRPQKVT